MLIRFKKNDGTEYPQWEEKQIKDIFEITRGYVLSAENVIDAPQNEKIYPVYSSQTKNNGIMGYYNDYLYEDAITWTTDGANAGTTSFRKGKFYCTNVCGVLLNKGGYANQCIAEAINLISKKYVSYVGNPKLMNNVMATVKIKLPCLEEQQKIADFLFTVDQKIESQKAIVADYEELKKGTMQKIFNQEIRFKDDDGNEFPEWKEYKFSYYLSSRNQKQIPTDDAPLMAFTATGGVCEKGERYDRSFLVKDKNKQYKRTEFNDFIYSSNNLDVGSIGLNKYGTAVISDVYEIFKFNKNGVPNFISEFIKNPKTLNKVLRYRQGALYGQYRIYAEHFLGIKEYFPCLEEQKKIADCLSALDRKIETEKKILADLEEFKKGLLQAIFNN